MELVGDKGLGSRRLVLGLVDGRRLLIGGLRWWLLRLRLIDRLTLGLVGRLASRLWWRRLVVGGLARRWVGRHLARSRLVGVRLLVWVGLLALRGIHVPV
jgi:hypothetical protein